MAAGVEMGGVLAPSALEIDAAEAVAGGIDATAASRVEHGDAVVAAHAKHGVDHLLAVAALEVLAHPRREEQYLRPRILLYEARAQLAEPTLEQVEADGIEPRGIVVATYHKHIIECVGHVGITLVHARAPPLEVNGYAVAVAPVVVVGHAVLCGQLVVPRVLDGFFVVAHVAVANHTHALAPQRVGRLRRGWEQSPEGRHK